MVEAFRKCENDCKLVEEELRKLFMWMDNKIREIVHGTVELRNFNTTNKQMQDQADVFVPQFK